MSITFSSSSGSPSSLSQSSNDSNAKSAHQVILGIDPPSGSTTKRKAAALDSDDDDDGDDDDPGFADIIQEGIIVGLKNEILYSKKKNNKEIVDAVLTAIAGKTADTLQHDAGRLFDYSTTSKSAMRQMCQNLFNYHCVLANEARESKPLAKHLQWKDLAQKFTFVLSEDFQQREEIGM
jgi:hypothetical protein